MFSILVNGLRTRFQGINILSEETNPQPQVILTKDLGASIAKQLSNDPLLDVSQVLVTVDPLDATKVAVFGLIFDSEFHICAGIHRRLVAIRDDHDLHRAEWSAYCGHH